MKKILIATAVIVSLLTLFSNTTKAQDSTEVAKDSITLTLFDNLYKGDLLPFKFIYQKIRAGEDTTVTCAIIKDMEFEVVENNQEEEYVLFNLYQTNFRKEGPEANLLTNLRATNLVDNETPIKIIIDYSGNIYFTTQNDSLLAKAQRNMLYVVDTLVKRVPRLKREELLNNLEGMKDERFALEQATNFTDLADLFFFYRWIYYADETHVAEDSIYCLYKEAFETYPVYFEWDKQLSKDNPELANVHILRSGFDITGLPTLKFMTTDCTEKEAEELFQTTDKEKWYHIQRATMIADKAYGLPIVFEKNCITGFYSEPGDPYSRIETVIFALDFSKLNSEKDDENEEEDDENRYDEYGIIKVR